MVQLDRSEIYSHALELVANLDGENRNKEMTRIAMDACTLDLYFIIYWVNNLNIYTLFIYYV